MKKPDGFEYNERRMWVGGKVALVEYVVWKAGAYTANPLIAKEVLAEFGVAMSPNVVTNLMAQLVLENKVLRVSRGIYLHASHAELFQ
jgi:hypothetical protein